MHADGYCFSKIEISLLNDTDVGECIIDAYVSLNKGQHESGLHVIKGEKRACFAFIESA